MATVKENKPSSRKAKDKQKNIINDKVFREFFGDSEDSSELIQISFDDVDNRGKASEHITTVRPREFLKTGDRISTDIVKGFKDGQAVYKAKNKTSDTEEPIVIRVSFAYKNVDIFAPKDSDDKGFTSLDKEVHDAVVSLYAAGNKVFSPAMVYRTMAGKNDTAFVPQEKLKEITSSIYKCMSSIITIDASEEAEIYGLESMYSQNLIYAKAVTLKTKGWEINAFMLIDEPVLYKYAKMKRQVFSIPLRVLDSPPSKTNDIIVLQGYLMRIVESLRRPKTKTSNIVLYSTLYDLLDCNEASKQKLQRVRNNIKSILNYWLEIGYINNFKENILNKSKHSIELEVSSDKFTLKSL